MFAGVILPVQIGECILILCALLFVGKKSSYLGISASQNPSTLHNLLLQFIAL